MYILPIDSVKKTIAYISENKNIRIIHILNATIFSVMWFNAKKYRLEVNKCISCSTADIKCWKWTVTAVDSFVSTSKIYSIQYSAVHLILFRFCFYDIIRLEQNCVVRYNTVCPCIMNLIWKILTYIGPKLSL